MSPAIVAMLLDEQFFLFLKSCMSRVYYSVRITFHFIRYHTILTYYGVCGAGDENTEVCNADVRH